MQAVLAGVRVLKLFLPIYLEIKDQNKPEVMK